MGGKEEKSLLELLLKDSHIVQWMEDRGPRENTAELNISSLPFQIWIMLTGAVLPWLRKTGARTRTSTVEEYLGSVLQWAGVYRQAWQVQCGQCHVASLKLASRTASPAVQLLLRHCAVHQAHAGNVKCGPGISLQLHPRLFLCLPHVLFGCEPNSRKKNRHQFYIVGVKCIKTINNWINLDIQTRIFECS